MPEKNTTTDKSMQPDDNGLSCCPDKEIKNPTPGVNVATKAKCSAVTERSIWPYDFLRPHPSKKEYKNKRTGKAVKACIWAPGVVEITFTGIKYSKTGTRCMGQKTRTMSKDEFNRKYYLHDNGL